MNQEEAAGRKGKRVTKEENMITLGALWNTSLHLSSLQRQ